MEHMERQVEFLRLWMMVAANQNQTVALGKHFGVSSFKTKKNLYVINDWEVHT